MDYKQYNNVSNNSRYILFYFDSKGSRVDSNNCKSIFDLITEKPLIFDNELNIIVRPHKLTTFLTLVNDLDKLKRYPTVLITNVGFVDYTPKKLEILSEHINNANDVGVKIKPTIAEKNYKLSNGESVKLYNTRYSNTDLDLICDRLNKIKKLVFINSSLNFKNKNHWKRERPISFFNSLIDSNILIRNINKKIKKSILINMEESTTFDGVHWTCESHKKLYYKLLKE